jgi:hypothetical protein
MRLGIQWLLVVTTLALAPTVVKAWEHGPGVEGQRLRLELRRGWNDAMCETRRAMAEARREIRRARFEQRQAIREAYREARRAAQEARRYLCW